MATLFFRFRVVHEDKVIHDGPALIVCNHQSFLDPPLVSVAFQTPIHFLARKTLFDNRWFGGLIRRLNAIPVDQDRPDFTSLKTIIALLKKGERVLVFPEGSRSEDGQLGAAQPGVGLIIAKSGVPVLPMRLFGAYEALPRGAKRPRSVPVRLVVGDPVDFSAEAAEAEGKERYRKLAEKAMEAIATLELPPRS